MLTKQFCLSVGMHRWERSVTLLTDGIMCTADTLLQFLHMQSNKKSLALQLRSEDPFRRPIHSKSATTSNIVLRITVPRRTGRKRKRGSTEPFSDVGSVDDLQKSQDVTFMMKSLADNPQTSKIEALGIVQESHRFRGMSYLPLPSHDADML